MDESNLSIVVDLSDLSAQSRDVIIALASRERITVGEALERLLNAVGQIEKVPELAA